MVAVFKPDSYHRFRQRGKHDNDTVRLQTTGNSIAAITSYLLLPNPTGDDVTPYRGGHSGVEGHVIRTSTRRQIGIRVKLS